MILLNIKHQRGDHLIASLFLMPDYNINTNNPLIIM